MGCVARVGGEGKRMFVQFVCAGMVVYYQAPADGGGDWKVGDHQYISDSSKGPWSRNVRPRRLSPGQLSLLLGRVTDGNRTGKGVVATRRRRSWCVVNCAANPARRHLFPTAVRLASVTVITPTPQLQAHVHCTF